MSPGWGLGGAVLPKHQYFFKAPQMISVGCQVWEPVPLLNMLRECIQYGTVPLPLVCSHDRWKAHPCTDPSPGYIVHICHPSHGDSLFPSHVLPPSFPPLPPCLPGRHLRSRPGCTYVYIDKHEVFFHELPKLAGFSLWWPPTEIAAMLVAFFCAPLLLRNRAESAIFVHRNRETL